MRHIAAQRASDPAAAGRPCAAPATLRCTSADPSRSWNALRPMAARAERPLHLALSASLSHGSLRIHRTRAKHLLSSVFSAAFESLYPAKTAEISLLDQRTCACGGCVGCWCGRACS